MLHLIMIGSAGFFGSILRFIFSRFIETAFGSFLPIPALGTLFVNASGSFFMGLLTQHFCTYISLSEFSQTIITVGFLGSLTTFSTFSLETISFIQQDQYIKALVNVSANLLICFSCVFLGMYSSKFFFKP